VPSIDRTVEAPNGRRVMVMVGGGARAIAATIARGCAATRNGRIGGRDRGRRDLGNGAGFRSGTMSARPDRDRRGTAPWQQQC
jgi:hypothetical protein